MKIMRVGCSSLGRDCLVSWAKTSIGFYSSVTMAIIQIVVRLNGKPVTECIPRISKSIWMRFSRGIGANSSQVLLCYDMTRQCYQSVFILASEVHDLLSFN